MSFSQPNPARRKYDWLEVSRSEPLQRSAVERVADFLEITTGFDAETAQEQASRCIQCAHPSCVQGCPLNNRIPEWLALTAEGHFLEAAELSRSTSNMPEICSRICPQERLCEGHCLLGDRSEPVSIGAIERFINEYALQRDAVSVLPAPPNGWKVAVIGSGPGGLACADELNRLGYAVVVLEAQPLPGGLLVNGIPAFKLDKTLVSRRIQFLRQRGVEFRTGVRVGQDVGLNDLRERFDAVFFGIGAYQAKPLDLPGAELGGVYQALPFLIQKNVQFPLAIPPIDVQGKRVVVLGGGDTAMDCLRTAIRCGASETICAYRRDLANMPSSRKEYCSALDEGARFLFLSNPILIEQGEGDQAGQVSGVRFIRMQLGAPDASGRRKPKPVPDSEFSLPAEVLLVAYGFDPLRFPSDSDLSQIEVNSWGGVVVDENQMTNLPGVFAGGDLVRGPSLVVHAVRDARLAAKEIHRYVTGKNVAQARNAGL
jgi:glutamate synthase (NADPH) small chain